MNKWSSTLIKHLKDERGEAVTQIVVMIGGAIIFLILIFFGILIAQFIMTANEINDVSDTIMKDAMQVNNGLTPSVINYLQGVLVNKGLDPARITISGTPATVDFGTPMEGSIEYVYNLPFLSATSSIFPQFQVQPITISSRIYTYALGVVR